MNKEERIKRFRSMSSTQRQELILKKMKEKGIELGSGISNKKYDSKEVYELIHIASCFPELREKKWKYFFTFLPTGNNLFNELIMIYIKKLIISDILTNFF